MQLWLNGKAIKIQADTADTTLLNYLRDTRASTGTKEGCASGDCGACTVLVSNAEGTYSAINSCIAPLASVAGQAVITIEGLASDQQLHPVQQALVDCHASQCGFCTPGFALSIAALQHSQPEALDASQQRSAVIDAISGNLCRCTGYKPIVEAGIQSLAYPTTLTPPNKVKQQDGGVNCPSISSERLPSYWRPSSEAELRKLMALHPQAQLIAGGTDLMLEVTQRYQSLPELIDITGISSLTRIEHSGDTLSVGAAASYTDQERVLADIAPAYVGLLQRLGSRQIRNRGTMGGNICNASPIADAPPWLLVQEAELIIGRPEGGYRYQRLEDFYRGYKQTSLTAGEYLADVRFSHARLKCPVRLYKVSKRFEDDIAAVSGAFLLNPQGKLRIAFGGMAAIPKRAHTCEDFINGQDWRDASQLDGILAQAADYMSQDFAPLTDVRASAAYRLAMASSLLEKACRSIAFAEEDEFTHA